MLSRYKIYRGKRPEWDPLPRGIRQDTRWRTRHILRPTQEIVEAYLASPTYESWERFTYEYMNLLRRRFKESRKPFDAIALPAVRGDVFLGCSCPTRRNPIDDHCHTFLALEFMQERYPQLHVNLPGAF